MGAGLIPEPARLQCNNRFGDSGPATDGAAHKPSCLAWWRGVVPFIHAPPSYHSGGEKFHPIARAAVAIQSARAADHHDAFRGSVRNIRLHNVRRTSGRFGYREQMASPLC
jgi:hypothetical protein